MPGSTEKSHGDGYMLLDAADIRNGLAETKPGWVMGSFVPMDDPRFSREFEVKEWDLRSMRRDWRDGMECGNEYIAVLDGRLTVILGRLAQDGRTMGVEKEIELGPDQRIIIAPGIWRSFRATENVKALTIRHRSLP
jgi:mannose-6-phosphate isomerase-like protein (cupin superfamily)